MMAMSMFMGGSNPFEGMFDFNLDVDAADEEETESPTNQDEE